MHFTNTYMQKVTFTMPMVKGVHSVQCHHFFFLLLDDQHNILWLDAMCDAFKKQPMLVI